MTEESIFNQAVAKSSPAERAAFLEEVCAGDEQLKRQVEELLAANDRPDSVFETTPLTDVASFMPRSSVPKQLGDFQIVRQIGRGGMGVVYEARQLSLKRRVALKVLSGGLGMTAKAVLRFRREAEAAAKLHHTNIVPIYATGEEGAVHYYSMELIQGPSLDEIIQHLRGDRGDEGGQSSEDTDFSSATLPEWVADKVPYERPSGSKPIAQNNTATQLSSSTAAAGTKYFDAIAEMIADVADALDHAHDHGVIHRDVKPSNLLLAPDGRLSVNDFGLARILEQPGMTVSGEFVGSPLYMSPEQITAGRTQLDHRTDIYSLGATLYELLTLQPPFPGATRDEVLTQVLHKEPKPPRKLNRKVPADLETICLKAIERDPDRRYPTAGQLSEDLRRFVDRHAISARRIGAVTKAARWVMRRPALSIAILACSVLACIAGISAYHAHVQALDQLISVAIQKAWIGDFKGAQDTIDEALSSGANRGYAHLVQGLNYFFQADYGNAEHELEETVKLLPENVPAHAMLASTEVLQGFGNNYVSLLNDIETLPLRTPEDYLFKAYAQMFHNPLAALETIKTADAAKVSLHSPMAHAVRAHIYADAAMESSDQDLAREATKYASSAKISLSSNPKVLHNSVFAHLVASTILADGTSTNVWFNQAKKDARSLKRFPSNPDAAKCRYWVYSYSGRHEDAFEEIKRAYEEAYSEVNAMLYAAELFARGEADKSIELLNNGAGSAESPWYHMSRAFALTAQPDGARKSIEVWQRNMQRYQTGNASFDHCSVLRLVGRIEAAKEESQSYRTKQQQLPLSLIRPFDEAYLDYCCGTSSYQELLKAAGPSKRARNLAHFTIGMMFLGNSQRDVAEQHLRRATQLHKFYGPPFGWDRAFLARLKLDDNWPPRIDQ